MVFHRKDLYGTHYSWNDQVEKGDDLFSREPCRKLFNRFNGEQVLFIINYFGTIAKDFTVGKARIIEWEIAHHLPVDVKSERSVFNWIIETVAHNGAL